VNGSCLSVNTQKTTSVEVHVNVTDLNSGHFNDNSDHDTSSATETPNSDTLASETHLHQTYPKRMLSSNNSDGDSGVNIELEYVEPLKAHVASSLSLYPWMENGLNEIDTDSTHSGMISKRKIYKLSRLVVVV